LARRFPSPNQPYRNLIDAMTHIRQSAPDATIPPGWILLSHAHDELLNLLFNTRSAKLPALFAYHSQQGDVTTSLLTGNPLTDFEQVLSRL
jgi:hypothetical protein